MKVASLAPLLAYALASGHQIGILTLDVIPEPLSIMGTTVGYPVLISLGALLVVYAYEEPDIAGAESVTQALVAVAVAAPLLLPAVSLGSDLLAVVLWSLSTGGAWALIDRCN